MMRTALALALFAALPASAVTYTNSVGSYAGTVSIWASDALTPPTRDHDIWSGQTQNDFTANTETTITETGIVGAINPARAFSGSSRSAHGDLEWQAVTTGVISGQRASIQFTQLETSFEADQIALIRESGAEGFFGLPVQATLIASGSVLMGGVETPFAYNSTVPTHVSVYSSGNPDSIRWELSMGAYNLFQFQQQGVTYTGRIGLTALTLIPEPGTALLVGLGLAALSRRPKQTSVSAP